MPVTCQLRPLWRCFFFVASLKTWDDRVYTKPGPSTALALGGERHLTSQALPLSLVFAFHASISIKLSMEGHNQRIKGEGRPKRPSENFVLLQPFLIGITGQLSTILGCTVIKNECKSLLEPLVAISVHRSGPNHSFALEGLLDPRSLSADTRQDLECRRQALNRLRGEEVMFIVEGFQNSH